MNTTDEDIRIEKDSNGVEKYIFDPFNPLNVEVSEDDITSILKKYGVNLAVASMSSVRPLDESFLEIIAKRGFKKWISLEEHGLIGGLGSSILEWLSDKNYNKFIDFERIGTEDKFINKLGNQSYVREILKIDSKSIVNLVMGK